MVELRRGDVLSFRDRIRAVYGPRTVNRALQALKTSIREGIYREELSKDPTQGIGTIRYEIDASGTFTQAEIAAMFRTCPGPWLDQETYTFFLMLYVLGLRKGEALGLRWSAVNLDTGEVQIREALTASRQVKKPKWEKVRVGRIGQKTIEALHRYRLGREHVLGPSFIFCDAEGQPHAPGWALYRFEAAMKALKIDRKARHLRIHSYRHSSHSHLIAAGLSPELARIAFGWSTEQVQRGYTHLAAEDLVGQARIMDGLLG
jgi:integrase